MLEFKTNLNHTFQKQSQNVKEMLEFKTNFPQEKRKTQNKHPKVLYTTAKAGSATFFHKCLFVKDQSC